MKRPNHRILYPQGNKIRQHVTVTSNTRILYDFPDKRSSKNVILLIPAFRDHPSEVGWDLSSGLYLPYSLWSASYIRALSLIKFEFRVNWCWNNLWLSINVSYLLFANIGTCVCFAAYEYKMLFVEKYHYLIYKM